MGGLGRRVRCWGEEERLGSEAREMIRVLMLRMLVVVTVMVMVRIMTLRGGRVRRVHRYWTGWRYRQRRRALNAVPPDQLAEAVSPPSSRTSSGGGEGGASRLGVS
jgi:hypothetical protein